jgi:hypothetical protein
MILQQLEMLYRELQSGEFLANNVWQNEDEERTAKDALRAARHTLKRAANMKLSELGKQHLEYCETALDLVAEQVAEMQERAAETRHYWQYRNGE